MHGSYYIHFLMTVSYDGSHHLDVVILCTLPATSAEYDSDGSVCEGMTCTVHAIFM